MCHYPSRKRREDTGLLRARLEVGPSPLLFPPNPGQQNLALRAVRGSECRIAAVTKFCSSASNTQVVQGILRNSEQVAAGGEQRHLPGAEPARQEGAGPRGASGREGQGRGQGAGGDRERWGAGRGHPARLGGGTQGSAALLRGRSRRGLRWRWVILGPGLGGPRLAPGLREPVV